MPGYGGLRPGAGRPKGSPNRLSRKMVELAFAGLHPLELLLSIVRDDSQPTELRIAAAKGALPYCAHRLHAVDVSVLEPEARDVRELTRDELLAIAAGEDS